MLLTDAAISRRSTVFAFMIIIFIAGLFSYATLPRESEPDITIPIIMVMTNYEGAASEDVENLITLPLERKLKSVKNVKEVRSVSAEGASMVEVEFDSDVIIDDALQKVRDKVGKATRAQLEEIATTKMADLNAADMDAAVRIIAGTARSMGIETDEV